MDCEQLKKDRGVGGWGGRPAEEAAVGGTVGCRVGLKQMLLLASTSRAPSSRYAVGCMVGCKNAVKM